MSDDLPKGDYSPDPAWRYDEELDEFLLLSGEDEVARLLRLNKEPVPEDMLVESKENDDGNP